MNTVPATFNKLSKSGKSALIMVKANAFEFGATPVYVPASAVSQILDTPIDQLEKGMPFEIASGFKLVDIVDSETGEVRTTESGIHLKQLSYEL